MTGSYLKMRYLMIMVMVVELRQAGFAVGKTMVGLAVSVILGSPRRLSG